MSSAANGMPLALTGSMHALDLASSNGSQVNGIILASLLLSSTWMAPVRDWLGLALPGSQKTRKVCVLPPGTTSSGAALVGPVLC